MLIRDLEGYKYHAGPELSASGLKQIRRSPAHFLAYRDGQGITTQAMKDGSLIHTAVLEPNELNKRYAYIEDGLDRRTKEGKAAYQAIIDSGKEPVKYEDYMTALYIYSSVIKNRTFANLLKLPHLIEASIFFERDGVKCRCRPDFMIEPCEQYPYGLIVDLKSTDDASEIGFNRSVYKYSYDLQAEFYRYGFQAEYKTAYPPQFVFLPVEKTAPFANALYTLPGEVLDRAYHENNELIALFKECINSNTWRGYESGIVELPLPGWIAKEIDESFEFGDENNE